ncbi:serine/threonine-protein kinase [Rubripirellula amarantea]|uniref:serine/threonine-protein kinase n=1 Tax=Rubripirellula amarantea TaxID=2527999 RepID=UPI001F5E90DA|nr:serine/threonine-protein kinase [Rubripirellula amarantea]
MNVAPRDRDGLGPLGGVNSLGETKAEGKRPFLDGVLDKLRRKQPDQVMQNGSLEFSLDGDLDVIPGERSLSSTQVLGTQYPPAMQFTYSAGSKPLPRYTVRRGIGVGGFGEVYFAVSDSGKEVALKRIQRNLEVELRGVSHCLNLKHPNLVSLFDVCQDDDEQWWVVMEYVAGLNLRQVLDDHPNGLPLDEVNRWFSAIAAGVGHLHTSGLVHRDIKPGNVFDDLGIVKVGDYGLSKFISATHRGGHTESVGTFHYMAPEIGRGQYGREIDIYALGILLYELLTGTVPFDGESCHEIIVKHLTATPDLSDVAEPYRSTIAKCLEKDPSRRFSNVDAMLSSIGLTQPSFAGTSAVAMPIMASLVGQKDRPLPQMSPATPFSSGTTDSIQSVTPVQSKPIPTVDEPLARALRTSFSDLGQWWRTLDRSPGAKAFTVAAGIIVVLINTHWLLPFLSVVAVVYVPYYVVRQMVLHVRQQPSYAQAQRIATANGVPVRALSKSQWRHHVRSQLRAKHSVHRIAELNTSWIATIFTVSMLGLIAGIVGLRTGPITPMTIAPYGFVAAVVLLASVSLLGLGKLWEREDGEGLTRRLVLSGVGAAIGFAAYSLNQFLMLPVDQGLIRDVDASALPQALYSPDGVPTVAAMMAHFALLFAALRWWKPIDPIRRTRLSLWAVAVAVVGEWAVHQMLPIPQPTGMLIAGGIAIAVQMSAPWINPKATDQKLGPRVAPAGDWAAVNETNQQRDYVGSGGAV